MAAKTPSSIIRESAGSLTSHIATFADIDNGDTWASGVPGIVFAVADNLVGVTVSGTTLTFTASADNLAVKALLLSKS
jgi:hypothetical protein